MLTKVCTTCEVEKLLGDYNKEKRGKHGVRAKCKCCSKQRATQYDQDNKEAKAAYRNANKEAIAERDKTYYQANKESITKQVSVYRQANKEAIAAYQRAYREANQEVLREREKAYKKANPHIFNALAAKRKANKLMATPAWADLEAIKGIYELAAIVNRTSKDIHVDHIVPLQSDLVCGLHCEANLQLMAASDNISKGNRQWPDMP
jgi:hypothetical protein